MPISWCWDLWKLVFSASLLRDMPQRSGWGHLWSDVLFSLPFAPWYRRLVLGCHLFVLCLSRTTHRVRLKSNLLSRGCGDGKSGRCLNTDQVLTWSYKDSGYTKCCAGSDKHKSFGLQLFQSSAGDSLNNLMLGCCLLMLTRRGGQDRLQGGLGSPPSPLPPPPWRLSIPNSVFWLSVQVQRVALVWHFSLLWTVRLQLITHATAWLPETLQPLLAPASAELWLAFHWTPSNGVTLHWCWCKQAQLCLCHWLPFTDITADSGPHESSFITMESIKA